MTSQPLVDIGSSEPAVPSLWSGWKTGPWAGPAACGSHSNSYSSFTACLADSFTAFAKIAGTASDRRWPATGSFLVIWRNNLNNSN